VLEDAGVLVDDADPLDVVAELLSMTTSDEELRAALRARGAKRLERYDRDAVAVQLRQTIEGLVR
jgi:glycosyltransferase involved in cell wall biosynthesis